MQMRDLPIGFDSIADGWTPNDEYLAQAESTDIVHEGVIAYALMCRLQDLVSTMMEAIPDNVPVSGEVPILIHAVKDGLARMQGKAEQIHDNECERHNRAHKYKLFRAD